MVRFILHDDHLVWQYVDLGAYPNAVSLQLKIPHGTLSQYDAFLRLNLRGIEG